MGEFIEFHMGGIAKNAGLCGLVYILESLGAIENKDYVIGNNKIQIEKAYFDNVNWADAYIKSHVGRFCGDLPIDRLIDRMKEILRLNSLEKDTKTKWTDICKKIKEMETKRYGPAFSFIADISEEYRKKVNHILSLITSLDKKEIGSTNIKQLIEYFSEETIYEFLAFADIKLFLPAFWNNVSFLNRSLYKKNNRKTYEDFFIKKMKTYENEKYKTKGKSLCVECGNKTAEYFNLGFINQINDAKRKTSQFWNMNNQSVVCPECAWIYTLMPLGFTKIGGDFLFINVNGNLKDLIRLNRKNTYYIDEKAKGKSYLYQKVSIDMLEVYERNSQYGKNGRCGIQIDLRISDPKKGYINEISILDSSIIKIFHDCKSDFAKIYGKFIKCNDESINVYDQVITRLLNKQSLFQFLDQLMQISMQNGIYISSLYHILSIESNRRKNDLMNQDKLKNNALIYGKKMREILVSNSGKDNKNLENKLRGIVYKLQNSIRTNNSEYFTDVLINLYTSYGLSIPSFVIECLDNDKIFQIAGRAYLIGLTQEFLTEKKENNKNEN